MRIAVLLGILLVSGCVVGDVMEDETTEDAVIEDDGEDVGDAEESLSTRRALLPSGDVLKSGVTGVGDATALYRNVDDGTSFTSADNATTEVRTTGTGVHTVSFAGAPAGIANQVSVYYRARRSGLATGTIRIKLYDGAKLVATGPLRTLSTTYTSYSESFAGLFVRNANALQARVELTKAAVGTATLSYTQIWLSVQAVQLEWPMPGVDAREWVVTNYVDLDRAEGTLRDYRGSLGVAAKTYDNHNGIDISVRNFRAMDENFPILAAASGKVVALAEDNYDRNMVGPGCSLAWNYVRLDHGGFQTIYGHLKKFSVPVAVGDTVTAGQQLGVVGSSGCSSGAHLHFMLLDNTGAFLEPFSIAGAWRLPPVYDTPLGFMDAAIKDGSFTSGSEVSDPGPDATAATNSTGALGVGLSIAGGKPSDVLTTRYLRPDGTLYSTSNITYDKVYRKAYWYSNRTLPTAGVWTIDIQLNGVSAKKYTVRR